MQGNLFCVIRHEKLDMTSMTMRYKMTVSLRRCPHRAPSRRVRAAPQKIIRGTLRETSV